MFHVKKEPGVTLCHCVCCLQEIHVEDESIPQTFDLLASCFSIELPTNYHRKRTICPFCIQRLLIAQRFKHLILDSLPKSVPVGSYGIPSQRPIKTEVIENTDRRGDYGFVRENNSGVSNSNINTDGVVQSDNVHSSPAQSRNVCKKTKKSNWSVRIVSDCQDVRVNITNMEHFYPYNVNLITKNPPVCFNSKEISQARSREVRYLKSVLNRRSAYSDDCPIPFVFKQLYKNSLFATAMALKRQGTVAKRVDIEKTHEGECFKCSVCPKTFLTRKSLMYHKMRHGPPTITCTVCPKMFKTNDELRGHMKRHKETRKFQCTECPKAFRGKDVLLEHMKHHGAVANNKCPFCPKAFVFQCFLNQHVACHALVRNFQCTHCPKAFKTKSNLTKHVKVHDVTNKIKCSVCPKKLFPNLDSEPHKNFQNDIQSPVCDKVLENKEHSNLPQQLPAEENNIAPLPEIIQIKGIDIKRENDTVWDLSNSNGNNNENVEFNTGLVPIKTEVFCEMPKEYHQSVKIEWDCRDVQVNLINIEHLYKNKINPFIENPYVSIDHEEIHLAQNEEVKNLKSLFGRPNTCPDECSIPFVFKQIHGNNLYAACLDVGKRQETSGDGTCIKRNPCGCFKCTICSKIFSCHGYLMKHMKRHEAGTFKCTLCPKSLRTDADLKRHLESHSDVCKFHCADCPKAFKGKDWLMEHMKNHGAAASHRCPFCPKAFVLKCFLNQHLRSHSQVRNFPCPQCPKTFKTRRDVIQHAKVHEKNKSFKCTVCPKIFSKESDLECHVENHGDTQNFKCGVCSKEFMRRSKFKQHVACHGAVKNLKCPLCPKMFDGKSNLERHINYHNNVRNFKCTVCSRSYLTKGCLTQHMKKHDVQNVSSAACAETFPTNSDFKNHVERHDDTREYKMPPMTQIFQTFF